MEKEKQAKERILYNSYDVVENYHYAKESLIEEHRDEFPEDKDWEPDEEKINERMHHYDNISWNDFEKEFRKFMKDKQLVLFGNIGQWFGTYQGGFVINDFSQLIEALEDCDYIKVYDKNGHLYLNASHHDGTHYFEIKELTKRGTIYHENNEDDFEVVEKLFSNNIYSKLPNYAHHVMGFKKREYEIA